MTDHREQPTRSTSPARQEPDWARGPIAVAMGEALPSFQPIEELVDA